MEDTGYYYVKNWWKYQHYRDRTPPWIKVHRRVLSNDGFLSLSPADRWYLVRLWIEASEHDGTFPARSGYVRATCGLGSDHQASCLLARLERKLLISLNDVRGSRRMVASKSLASKTDTETEKEKEKKQKEKSVAKTATFVLPEWVPEENWKQYLEMRRRIKKPMTDYAMKLAVQELAKLRSQGQDIGAVINQSVMNSWQGLFAVGGKSNGRLQGQDRSDANRRAFEEALRRGEERDRQEALRAKRSDG